MKKVYINNTPLIFCSNLQDVPQKYKNKQALHVRYSGKSKNLLNYIDNLEKNHLYSCVVIWDKDLNKLWSDFRQLYKTIEASGGLVINEVSEMLLIFRRGYWDLPKGKIEKGEKKKEAGIREVEEETGAQNLKIISKIQTSYHTYRDRKDRRILKKTYWYLMKTEGEQLLSPQIEEDIEATKWVEIESFNENTYKMYGNILEVIENSSILGKF